MISVAAVTKGYPGNARVLDQINMELSKGEFVYLVGGSGAGKSTLLRMLGTEELPTSGSIKLFGYDLQKVGPATLRSIRRAIGYIPQDLRILKDLTVMENIMLALSVMRITVDKQARVRVSELAQKLELHEKLNMTCRNLSGGELQRVAVARALAREPQIILADEPTGAQDFGHIWSVMDLLVKINESKQCTVLLATHDREIIRRIRKRCALLHGGQLRVENRRNSMPLQQFAEATMPPPPGGMR